MSNVMVSIESPLMVSCLTPVVSNIVSLVVFEISDADLGRFKVKGHGANRYPRVGFIFGFH